MSKRTYKLPSNEAIQSAITQMNVAEEALASVELRLADTPLATRVAAMHNKLIEMRTALVLRRDSRAKRREVLEARLKAVQEELAKLGVDK